MLKGQPDALERAIASHGLLLAGQHREVVTKTHSEDVGVIEAVVTAESMLVGLRMALVVVDAFDRQVSVGNVTADNKSLNANLMTMYLAEKMGMPLPELGPDFYAFMSNLTPVEEK